MAAVIVEDENGKSVFSSKGCGNHLTRKVSPRNKEHDFH